VSIIGSTRGHLVGVRVNRARGLWSFPQKWWWCSHARTVLTSSGYQVRSTHTGSTRAPEPLVCSGRRGVVQFRACDWARRWGEKR